MNTMTHPTTDSFVEEINDRETHAASLFRQANFLIRNAIGWDILVADNGPDADLYANLATRYRLGARQMRQEAGQELEMAKRLHGSVVVFQAVNPDAPAYDVSMDPISPDFNIRSWQ